MSSAKINTLIICTNNSARSQMAEAFLRKYGSDLMSVYSAGTEPTSVHPLVVKVMQESGIDISSQRAKPFTEFLGVVPVYFLIVFNAEAEERCTSVWPGAFERDFWPFEDPSKTQGSEEEMLAAFRRVRDLIDAKAQDWVAQQRKVYKGGAQAVEATA